MITIRDRWTDTTRWEGAAATMRAAVEMAVASAADLREADLRGVDLPEANLRAANLRGADLREADLRAANLRGANLREADLREADLRGVDLRETALRGADLSGANLHEADLREADLRGIRADLYDVLSNVPVEVPVLLDKIEAGLIDGSVYEGECCCLVGTLAVARGCGYREIVGVSPDVSRPAERWFLAIRRGDTPDRSQVAAITVGWIEEWMRARQGGEA